MLKIEDDRLREIIGDTLPDKEERENSIRIKTEVLDRFMASKGINDYLVEDHLHYITLCYEEKSKEYRLTVDKSNIFQYSIFFETPRLTEIQIYTHIEDAIQREIKYLVTFCSVYYDDGKGPVFWELRYLPGIEEILCSLEGVEMACRILRGISELIIRKFEKTYLAQSGFSYLETCDNAIMGEGDDNNEKMALVKIDSEGSGLKFTYYSNFDRCLKTQKLDYKRGGSILIPEKKFFGIDELDQLNNDRQFEIQNYEDGQYFLSVAGTNRGGVWIEMGQIPNSRYYYTWLGINASLEPSIIAMEEEGIIKFFYSKSAGSAYFIANMKMQNNENVGECKENISLYVLPDYFDYTPILIMMYCRCYMV